MNRQHPYTLQPPPPVRPWNVAHYASNGRFVATMATDVVALLALQPGERLLDLGCGDGALTAELAASFFPSSARYRELLEAAGFTVQIVSLHPRPTPLPGGSAGMERWLNTFRNGVLDRLPPSARQQAMAQILALLRPVLADRNGEWTADYVRLRFHATRPVTP